MLRFQHNLFNVTAGQMDGRGGLSSRSCDTGSRSSSAKSAIDGARAIGLATTENIPLGNSLGSLRLGTTEVREQFARLGVQSGRLGGGGGILLLLPSSFFRQNRRVRGGSSGRSILRIQFLINNIFNSDMVAFGSMLLLELLGGGDLLRSHGQCISNCCDVGQIQETRSFGPREAIRQEGLSNRKKGRGEKKKVLEGSEVVRCARRRKEEEIQV